MSETSTRRGGFTKRVRRLMDHYELAERLATITGRVDEAALRRAQPLGADIIAAFDALTERMAELEGIRVAAIKFLKAHVPSGEEPDFIVDPEDVYDFDVALGRVQTYQTQGGYRCAALRRWSRH